MEERERRFPHKIESFSSIVIVGASGNTGQVFLENMALSVPIVELSGLVRPGKEGLISRFDDATAYSDPKEVFAKRPEAIILAVPNPTEEALQQIADNLDPDFRTALILPQNGVDVVSTAQRILKDKNVNLIRASVFVTVDRENGEISYNRNKLRIGLAPAPDEGDVFSTEAEEALKKSGNLFATSGFDVRIYDNYKSMEWTKSVTNALASSGAVTGLNPRKTFRHPKISALELSAHHTRLEALRLEKIQFADIPWHHVSQIPLLDRIYSPLVKHAPVLIENSLTRKLIASVISAGRNDKPPAALRKIESGQPTELQYYLGPFIQLAIKHGLTLPLDSAILAIEAKYARQLIDMTTEQRIQLLIETSRGFASAA